MSNLLSAEALQGKMLFAIPKKGRLYEKCLELLAGADIHFKRQHRLDVALVQNFPMALVFLPAADIPRFVGEGNVDLGITGQDMVAEAGDAVSCLVHEELPLGFGKCKLQVQVPEASTHLRQPADLVGKKVATSFDFLAARYFAALDDEANRKAAAAAAGAAGRADGGKGEEEGQGANGKGGQGSSGVHKTRIEYVGGSVEAACALGLADGIVDLVESGETMRACGLHAIATLLESQAVLIRPKQAHARSDQQLIRLITRRLQGVIAASRYVLVQYNIEKSGLESALRITPGRRAATVSPLDDAGWNAVSAMVERTEVANVMDRLERAGASDILQVRLDNCRI